MKSYDFQTDADYVIFAGTLEQVDDHFHSGLDKRSLSNVRRDDYLWDCQHLFGEKRSLFHWSMKKHKVNQIHCIL